MVWAAWECDHQGLGDTGCFQRVVLSIDWGRILRENGMHSCFNDAWSFDQMHETLPYVVLHIQLRLG